MRPAATSELLVRACVVGGGARGSGVRTSCWLERLIVDIRSPKLVLGGSIEPMSLGGVIAAMAVNTLSIGIGIVGHGGARRPKEGGDAGRAAKEKRGSDFAAAPLLGRLITLQTPRNQENHLPLYFPVMMGRPFWSQSAP